MDVLEAFCNEVAQDGSSLSRQGYTSAPSAISLILTFPARTPRTKFFKEKYEALKTKAMTIMEALRKTFGTEEYTAALRAVGKNVKHMRTKRASKRHIEAITQPERHGLYKKRKYEKTKERRKEKGQMHRDLRRGYQ